MTGTADLKTLKTTLATYGSKPAHWPEGVRADLTTLVAKNPEAKRLQAEALVLDQALDCQHAPAPASDAFITRILEAAEPRAKTAPLQTQAPAFSWRDMLAPVSGLVLACTLGVLMGLSSLGRTSDELLYLDASDYIAGNVPLIEDLESLK